MSTTIDTSAKYKSIKIVTASSIFMCILGAVFYSYEYYLRVAPTVMIPELLSFFNINYATLGGLTAYYYFAYVPAQIPAGLMMDKWGPRRILTIACFLSVIGNYMFINESIIIAKAGRFLLGFGAAFAYVGVLKIASLWLPKKYFALVAGLATTLGMIGAMSGTIIMTKLVETFGWQNTLVYASGTGIILAVIIWLFIKDKVDKSIIAETRASHENVTLLKELKEIMKIKAIWIAGLIGFLTYLPLSIFGELWAVPFLTAYGLSKADAATGVSLVFLGFAIGSPFWGYISEVLRSRKKPLVIGATAVTIISFYLIWLTPNSIGLIYILLFGLGFFTGTEILVFAIGNDVCAHRLVASAVAFVNMLVMSGGFIFQPIVGNIIDFMNVKHDVLASFAEYRIALLILPIGLFISVLLSLSLKETYS